MGAPCIKARAPGTGSVHKVKGGRWQARTPAEPGYPHGRFIESFPTRWAADRFLDRWHAERSRP